MTRTIAVSALMMAPLVMAPHTSAASVGPGDRRVVEAVRRVDGQEVRALLANDTRALSRIWSNTFVVTNPLNQFANKQQVLGLITSGVLAFRSYNRQIEYVGVHDNMVVVAGSETVLWAGKMPLAGKTSHLRFTAIWTQQGGQWKEVARHANIIPEP